MPDRKENRRYTFTVEGETEKWYLEWLQNCLNSQPQAKYVVKIVSSIQQNPKEYAKRIIPISTPKITHFCDYESNNSEHTKKFANILAQLKSASSVVGKSFHYCLGYSNYTFELWMILHKQDCNTIFTDRSQYLGPINKAFHENFLSLKQYKEEKNFKRCLAKLSLDNVKQAIRRSKEIMDSNQRNGFQEQEHKGYHYYRENPSLTVWKAIEDILKECGLL